MTSQYNIDKRRGSCADYNANNSWYFNGTNGNANNNNRYNGNFRSRPVLDYCRYDNASLADYSVPLDYWLIISEIAMKGKKSKPSYVFFKLNRIAELIDVAHQVGNCEIMPSESTAHIVTDPRVREIVCANASKRCMQTYYIRELQPYLERCLYHDDSYSCRPGRGSLKAIQRLHDYVYEATEGYTRDAWIAKVDIKAFFMSLDCYQIADVVTRFIRTEMKDHPQRELLVYITRQVYLAATKDHLKDMARPFERALLDPVKSLYNRPYYTGVPIGDWTSQTAGLIMTTAPLRYLESLGYKFVHYTDDTIIVVPDKRQWLEDVERLARFYKEQLGLVLHPQKRYLQHYSKGVEALGYKVRFDRTLPSDRIHHNILWYLERTVRKAEEFEGYALANAEHIVATLNSYLGLLRWCNAYRLREQICRTVSGSALGRYLQPSDDCTKIVIRDQYTRKNMYKKALKSIKNLYKHEIRQTNLRSSARAAELPVRH